MSNRISHSQINKFVTCNQAWAHHYVNRYRPLEMGSALIFGSALGKALEYALNENCLNAETKEYFTNIEKKKVTTYDVFDYHWAYQEINGKMENLKEYPYIAYSRYDLDTELANTPYESLRAKGHLMIDTFIEELLPLIEKVYSTEEKTELSNEEGDSNIGFADAVVQLKGYHKPVILDFKSASRPYELDSVKKSVQLASYLHVLSEKYENTRLAGYAVFLKNIEKNRKKVCKECGFDGTGGKHKTCANEINEKRCGGEWKETIKPKAVMQLIVDDIPEFTEMMVVDNIAAVNDAIKSGVITKNLSKCDDNFGRPCEFKNLCWSNSTEGLVKLDKKES